MHERARTVLDDVQRIRAAVIDCLLGKEKEDDNDENEESDDDDDLYDVSGIEVQDLSKGEKEKEIEPILDIFVDLSLPTIVDKKVSKKIVANSAVENMKKREKIALGFKNFDSKIYADLCRVYTVTQQVRMCVLIFADCDSF